MESSTVTSRCGTRITGNPKHAIRSPTPCGAPCEVWSGLQVAYASALAAGGMARLIPSHLRLLGKLRTIPDTVEDFVGYHIADGLARR